MNQTPTQKFKADIVALLQEVMEEADIFKTCINCKNFREEALELCVLSVPPSRPPARVIAFGCPAFVEVQADVEVVRPVPSVVKPVRPPAQVFDDMDDDIPF